MNLISRLVVLSHTEDGDDSMSVKSIHAVSYLTYDTLPLEDSSLPPCYPQSCSSPILSVPRESTTHVCISFEKSSTLYIRTSM